MKGVFSMPTPEMMIRDELDHRGTEAQRREGAQKETKGTKTAK